MSSIDMGAGSKATLVQDSYLNQDALNSVKSMGRAKDPQALKEVAKKFEAMFVQQMLKTMRDTNDVFSEDSYFNSNEEKFHRDMLDQQMVLNLTSGRGIGLADQFYRQMLQNYGVDDSKDTSEAAAGLDAGISKMLGELNSPVAYQQLNTTALFPSEFSPTSGSSSMQPLDVDSLNLAALMRNAQLSPRTKIDRLNVSAEAGAKATIAESPENFVALLKPHAEKAAAELKLNPDVLLAQVALETGWGKHVIHNRAGENSFNLFNIKSNSGWQGEKIKVSTLEYRQGIAAPEQAEFRKYQSYAESFADYVNLIKESPRYQPALKAQGDSAGYAEALEAAGYATDPNYAEKIKSLLGTAAISAVTTAKKVVDIPAVTSAAISLVNNAHQKLVE